jgi:geranylgeranyl pyrophosphate synthase
MADEESGIDELMRLSRQFTRQQEEHEEREKQREAQGKKVRGVLHGLQELNINMALQQLKNVAKTDIIKQVTAMKTGGGTDDLRKLISALADELEKQLARLSASKAEMTPLVNAMRTLNILLDLYFSFH